jgi:putative ATPase
MNDDLFAAAAVERRRATAPLAARMRPRTLDEVLGQSALLAPGAPLRSLIETDRLSSVLLWGPPGTGKTTLARLIATHTAKHFETLSAVSATVKDVREIIAAAGERLGMHDRRTILFLDEIHRFNKAQQDALLPAVEDGTIVLIGATTENPYFEVNPPLRSRSVLVRLEPLGPLDLAELARRGAQFEGTSIDGEATEHLVRMASGDARQLLTAVDVAVAMSRARGATSVQLADVEAALGTQALRYGESDHYDVISAFIKSMRGSDPDAALHWLARMLSAGEDARFIARRIVIAASEDVGLADPQALTVAVAAAHALEFVGLPEAQLNLAQAAVYVACAPKSNRVAMGIWNAVADVRAGVGTGEVPAHLRDAHYQGAQGLGHGAGYAYPHDAPAGWVSQDYLPDDLRGKRYYVASEHGAEAEIARRLGEHMDRNDEQRSAGPT